MTSRRKFLNGCFAAAVGSAPAARVDASLACKEEVVIDPRPLFDISPYLYMQFMEPLGVTDGSVEAAWDYDSDNWRKDLVDVLKDLCPDVVRFGGLFSRYYRWREGVGPVQARPGMRNYVWGGKERNRAGTHEFVGLCRRVSAEPLICVNFLSDGRRQYWKTRDGANRSGDAQEAADWVSYANDPDNRERRSHAVQSPYNIRLWQLGNETSYDEDGFSKDEAITHTLEFAKAVKQRDRSIQLIGWGDRGGGEKAHLWARDLLQRAGQYLAYVSIHMTGQRPTRGNTVLDDSSYQQEPERAWEELLEISNRVEAKVKELEDVISSERSSAGIAITEGQLSLRPHNANPILREWLCGVFHARVMNVYQRHGARVKIATAADFFGTRWTTNAVMVQVPRGVSYLMPVGCVMRLFKRHNGKQGITVQSCPSDLDIAASCSGPHVFLHVANLNFRKPVEVGFVVEGMSIAGGKVFQIAPESPREYVNEDRPDIFAPKEEVLTPEPAANWRFPPASVSAVELELKA